MCEYLATDALWKTNNLKRSTLVKSHDQCRKSLLSVGRWVRGQVPKVLKVLKVLKREPHLQDLLGIVLINGHSSRLQLLHQLLNFFWKALHGFDEQRQLQIFANNSATGRMSGSKSHGTVDLLVSGVG